MKREELTPIELECNMGKDINGVVHREPWKAYDIDKVDRLLDEKDAEIEDLLRQNRELCQAMQVMYSKEEYGKLQKEIESLKASHYAEMVDAGMRERRLRRALWMTRALRARDIQRWWLSATLAPITERACRVWNSIEIKCRKKAEEYK